ncbi:MAG TPA: prolyl oligopeptidase family serine peptidase [Nitriliruptorales bacterium]
MATPAPVAWRTARRAGKVLGSALAAVGSAAAVSAWIGTRVLTDAPAVRDRRPTLRARFLPASGDDPAVVHLSGLEAELPGRWGLRVDQGYLQLDHATGIVTDHDGQWTVRPYRLLEGRVPTAADQVDRRRRRQPPPPTTRDGDAAEGAEDRRATQLRGPWPVPATLTSYAWPDDPQILAGDHDASFGIEAIDSPRGYLPAWRFTPQHADERHRRTWMITIHGRGTRRSECFRLVHTGLEAGVTCLAISYRTDRWVRAPAALTTLGGTEWEDVETAVRLALREGAERIVLAGCSMGGALAAMFLRRSELGDRVAGVILDSPALSWSPILEHVATVRRIPMRLIPVVMSIARWRAKLDWVALDHLDGAKDFTHPILLIHGDADAVVPIASSDTFASVRPDLVTYVRLDGSGHVTGWNTHTHRYERAVTRFLDQVAAAPEAQARSAARRPGRFRRVQVRTEAARRTIVAQADRSSEPSRVD